MENLVPLTTKNAVFTNNACFIANLNQGWFNYYKFYCYCCIGGDERTFTALVPKKVVKLVC